MKNAIIGSILGLILMCCIVIVRVFLMVVMPLEWYEMAAWIFVLPVIGHEAGFMFEDILNGEDEELE